MKNPTACRRHSCKNPRNFLLLVVLSQIFAAQLHADGPASPPLLEFATGLPGKQVRLSWASEAGVRYRIERSTTLGVWSQIALVEASGTNSAWLDLESTTQKAFYRVMLPQPEVFAITPPLLPPSGGELRFRGQGLPPGSRVVLIVDGVARAPVDLDPLGGGEWSAIIGGALPGGAIISATVVDGSGATLVNIDQPITVTQTGLATDGPPALPPAAPVPVFASKPVPGIGVIVKKGPYFPKGSHGRMAGMEECDDGNLNPWDDADEVSSTAILSRQKLFMYVAPALDARRVGLEDCDDMDPTTEGDTLLAFWLSRKGYDYSMGAGDSASARAGGNRYSLAEGRAGARIYAHSSRPAPSGLPGEVSFQVCDLALPCPAGPQLAWIRTYRSMKPVSSGHGPQWDFSYNIWIEPLPSTAGATAPRLVLHDGGGRSDILYRQADGTYHCDGMFREGAFDRGVFTLTFADKGKWTFNPLDDSPSAGRISAITDRFGVALSCSYDTAGRLQSVSDSFSPPRSLTVNWGAGGTISSVEDSGGRSVAFSQYAAGETGGGEGDLKQATPQGFGATVYTYTSGNADDALNHNLLEIRDGQLQSDGKGRLLEGFGYSADVSGISYDTCTSHDRHALAAGHVTLIKREMLPPGATPRGGYAVYETDEIGRVSETVFDAQHREVRVREYTGYWQPGTAVGSADLESPAVAKSRGTDPDFYETSAKFNADHQCSQLTRPDGSQLRVTYDRDFRPGCPVRERGNVRVMTIRTASGEERTVSREYLPGFGTPEPAARPGNPIKGKIIKGGRTQSPGIFGRPGNPIKGMTVKGGRPGTSGGGISGLVWSPRSNFLDDDSDGDGWAARGGGRKGWDGTIKGNLKREEGGRHTPFQNPYKPQSAAKSGIAGGAVAGIVVAAVIAAREGGGPIDDIDDVFPEATSARTRYKGWDGTIRHLSACDGFVTRMVNAYGQGLTWGYNENGACTSASITSLPSHGQLYQYNSRGQRTGVTVLNGPDSSFRDEMTYNPATGFLSEVIRDKSASGTGLHLTTTLVRDSLGRVTDVVDPMGSTWSYEYNSLDQCTRMQSPGPHRISVNLTYDNAGRIIRRDQDHLAADGSPFSSNPSYSTFYRYDGRARLDQVADEERPVDGVAALTAASLGIEHFAVCDITRDAAGQVVRLSTPAACRAQSTDLTCDFVYDERGMLFRYISGGTASPNPVTLQCDYHPDGSLARRALVGGGVPDSADTFGYDGFHRITSISNAEGSVLQLGRDNLGFTEGSVFSGPDPGTGSGQLMSHWRMRKRPEILFQAWENEIDSDLASSPFFDYLTEDDVIVENRFTPGSADGSVAMETTIVDRSPAGLVQSVTRNGDLLVGNEYDSAGRLVRCADGSCRVDLTLDGRDDVVVCGRTDHFRVAGAPPSETFTVTYVRDSLGRVTQRADGVGNAWTAAYDSFGRCVSSTAPGRPPVLYAYDGSSATDPFTQQTSCDVAGTGTPVVLGSLLVRCGELKSTTDSYGYSTVQSFDGSGRLSACVYPDGTSETTSYNSLGFVSGRGYRDGTSITITCDVLGRVIEMGWPGNPATYQYDALGRCTEATQVSSTASSTVAFTYDSLGNPVSETQTGVASAPQVISRSFNHRGRTAITYPGGASFLETRDEFGNLLSVSVAGAPPSSPPVVSMEYVGQRVWKTTQANGLETAHNYRSDGEPAGVDDHSFDACISRTTRNGDKVVICHSTASRAPDQLVSRTEEYFASGTAPPGRMHDFTRDNLGRVTACLTQSRATAGAALATESEVTYTLDLEGRRLTAVGGSNPGSYTQDDALPPRDRQVGQYSTWPGGPLIWDDAGNLLSLQKGTGALSFVYDAQGRLIACNQPGGAGLPSTPIAEFSYDALGRVMIHKVHRGEELPSIDETRYVYDGGVCIQELTISGAVSTSFVCVDGVQQSFANSAEQFFVNRGLQHWGTKSVCPGGPRMWPKPGYAVSLVTNGSGLPTERFDFDDACKPIFLDASGAVRPGASSAVGPIKWMTPGSLWVPETGMFHGEAGVYSPDLGGTVSSQKLPEKSAQKDLMNES